MKKASNEYGLPMNIQLFADGADAIADQPGEDSSQAAQEAAGQAKIFEEYAGYEKSGESVRTKK